MGHTFESAAGQIAVLDGLLAEHGRDRAGFDVTVGGAITDRADLQRWADLGVTRVITSPWRRGREAADGLRRLADALVG
jgi:phosphoribosylformimino-5-aminoimidazole carboxamide ribonucleotide (ProFAR) isomerase